MEVADGQREVQFAATGFGEEALGGALPQPAQLGFTAGALEAEQQPVVEQAGIVDAVRIEDDRVGQPAQLEELVPVAIVAGQARDFATDDRARAAQAYLRDEALKAGAAGGGGGGRAKGAPGPRRRCGEFGRRFGSAASPRTVHAWIQGGLVKGERQDFQTHRRVWWLEIPETIAARLERLAVALKRV